MKRPKPTTDHRDTTTWVADRAPGVVAGVRHYYHRDPTATPRCENCQWAVPDPEAGGVLYECVNPAVYDQPTRARRLACHGCVLHRGVDDGDQHAAG